MIRPFKDHRGRSCHQISAKNSRKCLRYIYFRFRRIFHEFFAVILTNNLLTILVFTYYYISAGRSRKDNMEIARLNLGLICVSEFRFPQCILYHQSLYYTHFFTHSTKNSKYLCNCIPHLYF